MIGDDGVSRFEVLLEPEDRDFIKFVEWKGKCKSGLEAVQLCIRSMRVFYQQKGEYPGNPGNPEGQI